MDYSKKKVVFADLDGTLIETITGSTHPKGIWDVKLKLDVFSKIKELFPNMTHFLVVTNQGGIEKGIVNPDAFSSKFQWVLGSFAEYVNKKGMVVGGAVCPTNDDTYYRRKPHTGMLLDLLDRFFQNAKPDKEELVMIGDASGKEGDFSDSDLKTAKNLGIEYIDVRDLLS